MRGAPTVHDVAREAGVSIASVSRALSGKTKNEATIRAVKEAALKVGYQPNAVGQSLQRQRTNQVLFAVPDIGNSAYQTMIRAAEPVFTGAELGLLLRSTGADPRSELELISRLGSRFTDGLVIAPLRIDDALLDGLARTDLPVTVMAHLPPGLPVDSVRTDSRAGARMAVEHLISAGCTRIAYIGGPADTGPGRSRLTGYREALEHAGHPVDERLIELANNFAFDGGREATHALLARADPDGLLAANDHLAIGAIHAAHTRGITVPTDLQVIGMDDSDLSVAFLPGLTSVNLRDRDRGYTAAELLVARLEKPDRPHEERVFEPWLSRRGSTL